MLIFGDMEGCAEIPWLSATRCTRVSKIYVRQVRIASNFQYEISKLKNNFHNFYQIAYRTSSVITV